MNKELKAKWVKALRSGNYKQGKMRLKHSGRYCCLGVLREVSGDPIRRGEARLGYLEYGLSVSNNSDLIAMNDGGKSFKEIAEWIEANL